MAVGKWGKRLAAKGRA